MRKDSSLEADGPKGHEASESERSRVRRAMRSAYDGSRVAVVLECLASEDRTQQSFRDECNINVLMKRYEKTGILPQMRQSVPQYVDMSMLDFTDAQNRVAEVRGVFSQLDARTRARFENDPANMLDFLADPANNAEAVKLGLMAKSKEISDGSDEAVAGVEGVGRAGSAGETDSAAGRKVAGAGEGAPGGAAARGGAGGVEGGQGRAAAVGA